jgi:hypothetical protein
MLYENKDNGYKVNDLLYADKLLSDVKLYIHVVLCCY